MNHDCPFCNLSRPLIVENEVVRAFWDGSPASPGHALVIPRAHIPTWVDADSAIHHAMTDAVPAVIQAIQARGLRPDGYNIGVNVGAAAGQTVFHLHMHIIPRYMGGLPQP